MGPTIAIDGPAAAGKGTLARRLAARFAVPHLDTGLLYRAVGRRVLDGGGDPADPATATAAARTLDIADLRRPDLRGPEADRAAGAVAPIPGVRAALLDYQRRFAAVGGVLDGRDIGTVVLPEATGKLFVVASAEARGLRRWRELTAKGVAADLATVTAALVERDRLDAERAASPLAPADDAARLDTTTLDADAAFAAALVLLAPRLEMAGFA